MRLLPSRYHRCDLNGIEIGEPGHEPRLRARTLGVEFALTPLMRGEWRASQLHIDAPQVTLGVDAGGHVDVPPASISFDPDQLSFDRIEVENGRAVLLDAASGKRTVLEQFSFNGDVRSLLGPFKGDGAFVVAGQRYGYRISGSHRGDDGGMRLRLSLDPGEQHAIGRERLGTLWVEGSRPRYEGTLTLAGPAVPASSSGQDAPPRRLPWRATSRVKATPTQALFEQVDFQYGPDDRAVKLTGTADLKFGAEPAFEAVLAARQVDLDRALRQPDAPPRTPLALLRGLTDTLAQFTHPPVPVKIGIGIDTMTLGGASVVGLHGDMHAEADGWSLDNIEFRAPGATQVHASGLLTLARDAPEFAGPARIDSADPKTLIAWLEGRTGTPRQTIGSLSARGDVTLGATRVAVERLKAEFDGKAVEGRLAYAFAADQRPARLDAALNAAQIDLDGALAFAAQHVHRHDGRLAARDRTQARLRPRDLRGRRGEGRERRSQIRCQRPRYRAPRHRGFRRRAVVGSQGAHRHHVAVSGKRLARVLAALTRRQQLAPASPCALARPSSRPAPLDLLRTTARRAAPAQA